jgi:hypothetical protein
VSVENEDVHMERDSTLELLCPQAEGAEALYELMLTMGADPCDSKAKVAELYSPPRVTTLIGGLPHVNLEAGMTFDLRMGHDGRHWDFLKAADRAKARQLISREKPFIVIGSPPCTDFSSWNTRLNHKRMSESEVHRRKVEAETLLGFAIEVYEHQMRHGRHFLHDTRLQPRAGDYRRCWSCTGRKVWGRSWATCASMASRPAQAGARHQP